MIAIGVDAHKRIHAALALDDAGTVLGSWRGANTAKGWMQLRHWANQWSQPRHWGIEGAWNYGRGLAQFLVAHHEVVFEINPRWTAERRGRYALNGGVMCTTDRSGVGGPLSGVHAVLAAASGVVARAAGATPPHSSNGR